MSLPPHRGKDAKVEGRDPPEVPVKDTMTAFHTLTKRLLRVPMTEVAEKQRLYDAQGETDTHGKKKRRAKRSLLGVLTEAGDKDRDANGKDG